MIFANKQEEGKLIPHRRISSRRISSRGILVLGLLSLGAAILPQEPSLAAGPPYRCGLYVQQRPCDQQFSHEQERNRRAKLPKFEIENPRTPSLAPRLSKQVARLSDLQYNRVAKTDGVFRGLIRTPGRVRLTLFFLNNGKAFTQRHIGEIDILESDLPTPFTFRTELPAGDTWSWKIVAEKSQVPHSMASQANSKHS